MASSTGNIFKYPVQIKESHLDTFGHVNNAKYLEIFEDARWDLVAHRGYGLEEVHRIKVGPIILGVDIQFKKELKNREKITITTQCISYEKKISKLKQEMIKSSGEVASTAIFTVGLFDFNIRKLILPTPSWLKAIGLSD